MRIFSTIICLIFIGQIHAQIITDRPDQTESSSTVGKGNLQLETGVLIGFESDDGNTIRQILAPTTLFRYGITGGVEVRLLSQFESQKIGERTMQGMSDLEVGIKFNILQDENKNTEIAFLSHLIIPRGTSELTSDEYGTINKLSISHALNDKAGIGYNVGYDYFGEGDGNLTYSIALGAGVNEKVGIYIEPYGEYQNLEEFIANFDAGVTYLANENLQFDFSFGTGLTDRMNYTTIGVSWLLISDNN